MAGNPAVNSEPAKRKLAGYEFYREVLGSPKYVVAPMVDQSELAWRRLSRRYGAQLIYTPMINAKIWADSTNKVIRSSFFDLDTGEEGDPTTDRPLIVQFCGNDPDKLLKSAKALEDRCDAVDINLGCPQEIAKKGKYGAFLQDDWDLIYKLINILHVNLSIPVTAKFRVFSTVEKTVEYAKMLERAGAQILTCHGRLREQRGQNAGLADWAKIRAVKESVSVPVFANGNILFQSDIEKCLRETGCDGVMSAEGQLYNAALFSGLAQDFASKLVASKSSSSPSAESSHSPLSLALSQHPRHSDLALEYLDIVKSLKTRTSVSAIKGHLFKIMRPALSRETDLRERLGKVVIKKTGSYADGVLQPYVDICLEMKERMDRDEKQAEGKSLDELVTIDEVTGFRVLPHWLAQPYWRPPRPAVSVVPAKRTNGTGEDRGRDEGKKAKLDLLASSAVASPNHQVVAPVIAPVEAPVVTV
ncbi:dihydrouridine synthase-domain-containing protein [Lentinula lateritia]|uniref:tRNA-dihydrouridine(16/17) synthase [NAD(P)(+)] n=1 Tax=Lentinula lateritia TaxID=40482 RepID=A0ABQ8V2C7_9AGAR|nr:dihydrouridine synthase-domain-containing protein [Lentinula lateritia]